MVPEKQCDKKQQQSNKNEKEEKQEGTFAIAMECLNFARKPFFIC